MELAAIVIPIYKNNLSENEEISIIQCCKILGQYNIHLVAPQSLDLKIFFDYYSDFIVERFENKHFISTKSYSELLMTKEFYQRFSDYKYMLLHQLDVYVFRNELEYWCNQAFDYIGAPWFTYGTNNHLDGKLWAVGNGGFSLRNIQSHLEVLNHKKPLKEFTELLKEFPTQDMQSKIKALIKSIGYKNNIDYVIRNFDLHEDFFWGYWVTQNLDFFKVPKPETALKFAFETDPEYLYRLNNNKLPFGCHAWEKWSPEFWKNHIPA